MKDDGKRKGGKKIQRIKLTQGRKRGKNVDKRKKERRDYRGEK